LRRRPTPTSVDGHVLGDAIVALDTIIGHLQAARLSVIRAHSRSQAWRRDAPAHRRSGTATTAA
jgi:hypothetical protein